MNKNIIVFIEEIMHFKIYIYIYINVYMQLLQISSKYMEYLYVE